MSHIVESCPLTKLNGGLYQLHSADEFLADQSLFITRIQQEEADYNYVSLRDKVMCLTGGVSNIKPCLYVSSVTKLDNGQAMALQLYQHIHQVAAPCSGAWCEVVSTLLT